MMADMLATRFPPASARCRTSSRTKGGAFASWPCWRARQAVLPDVPTFTELGLTTGGPALLRRVRAGWHRAFIERFSDAMAKGARRAWAVRERSTAMA